MRIGTLDSVIEAGSDGEQSFGWRSRESAAGRRLEALCFGGGCIVRAGESYARPLRLYPFKSDSAPAEEAGDVGRHAKRAELVEGGGDSISDAVIHKGIAAADRCLALAEQTSEEAALETGRPGKCQARGKVLIVVLVIAGLIVGRAAEVGLD